MAEREQMSQDNDTIKRFKELVDNGRSITEELTPEQIADIQEHGRLAMEAIDAGYKPPTAPERPAPKIHTTTEEVIPVELDLSLTPKETKQAISQTEATNILEDLLSGKIRVTPKTATWVGIATAAGVVATKLSGCW